MDRTSKIRLSTSRDDGVSWSPVVDSPFPNPGAGIEAIRLANGALGLDLQRHWPRGRHSLAVSLSDDEGATLEVDAAPRAVAAGRRAVSLSVDHPGVRRLDPRDLHVQTDRAREARSSTLISTRRGSWPATENDEAA